ncbi:MAG TPA: hypothetical protein PLU22_09205 [Polyangiaceae bacterium]|nr:hypothetical protein [Polyangiaceae bacterium]
MRGRDSARATRMAMVALATLALGCGSSGGPRAGGLTNWLRVCESDADCGELRCRCGACTRGCGDEEGCADLPAASCVPAEDDGAIALCGGRAPESLGMCLPRCSEEGCAPGTSCVAGLCVPLPAPTAQVTVDESQRFQSLVGIGAGIGYVVDTIMEHPRRAALLDAMFSGTGLGMIRLRNQHATTDGDLGNSGALVAAAAERLGRSPTVILNSASPPGELKANGSTFCENNPDTCTLVQLPDGTFDYTGLATHWRASLEAYALAGIEPEYISIQNNPDWVPPAGDRNEACRFLPAEGTATVTTDAGEVEVRYPGYAQALEAVVGALDGLPSVPQIVAPETTSYPEVEAYLAALDLANVDAIAHHLYGTDTTNLDLAALAEIGDLAAERDRPLFQSEMFADPLTTAVLMHAALAVEGASVFVHNGFVAAPIDYDTDVSSLIRLTADDFTVGDTRHVMCHYSAHIDPGWVRVAADSDSGELYASAWVSPADDRLVVVLTNPGDAEVVVELDPAGVEPTASAVSRTVLGGLERSADLGELPAENIVVVPPESMVTVTLER